MKTQLLLLVEIPHLLYKLCSEGKLLVSECGIRILDDSVTDELKHYETLLHKQKL
jgi:hypothetical protein